jgi:hypothetical protein
MRTFFATAMALVLIARAVPAARAQPEVPDFRDLEQLAQEELKATGTPGAAVAVILGDRLVLAKGFGVASVESREPVTPDTLFRIASTTKMLTAAALASLEEQGKVRFDAPISRYANGLDANVGRLTLHQLLSHTAGLRDESSYAGGMVEYLVVSDTEIKMLSRPYPKPERDIPKPYPKPFPQEGVDLQPIGFDPKDPAWLWNYGGILGVGKLTAKVKAATKKKFESWHQKTFNYPLIDRYYKWRYGDEDDPDLDDIVKMFTPFTQGMPEVICPNAEYQGHEEETSLPPLMYLQPDEAGYEDPEEDEVDKLLAGGDSGQLIWMVCPICMSVVVDNPGT